MSTLAKHAHPVVIAAFRNACTRVDGNGWGGNSGSCLHHHYSVRQLIVSDVGFALRWANCVEHIDFHGKFAKLHLLLALFIALVGNVKRCQAMGHHIVVEILKPTLHQDATRVVRCELEGALNPWSCSGLHSGLPGRTQTGCSSNFESQPK